MPPDFRLCLEHVPFPVALLEDPRHGARLRSALWLLLVLRALASPRTGLVHATVDHLAQAAGLKPETLLSLLGHLEKGAYVALKRDAGLLRIKLAYWTAPPAPTPTPESGPRAPSRGSRPLSADPLAQRIAETLGDMDHLAQYEAYVEEFPRAVVERALRDAAAMPESQIKRSRGALFTYLLRQYGNSQDDE